MPSSFLKKYNTFIWRMQMWITQRIGKNDGTKNSQKGASFFNIQIFMKYWQIQLFCKKIST